MISRLVDLEAIIRKNIYHPDFHGSRSIKRTLPVLAPEMSYEGLEIGDGYTAMSIFAFLALGKYGADEAETLKLFRKKKFYQKLISLVTLSFSKKGLCKSVS